MLMVSSRNHGEGEATSVISVLIAVEGEAVEWPSRDWVPLGVGLRGELTQSACGPATSTHSLPAHRLPTRMETPPPKQTVAIAAIDELKRQLEGEVVLPTGEQ